MTRKLVSIRKVLDLTPIEGADKIELAHIGGWQCVVSKGDFKINDLALYFEIDSFLPVEDRYSFLGNRCFKKMYDGSEGFRIKTIKLKGQLSQGLLLPLSAFSDKGIIFTIDGKPTKDDFSELLKVKLWENPLPESMKSIAKGTFPTHIIPKTDQERIQNLSELFNKYSDLVFEKTEKLDGSSGTYYLYDGHFGVCSRNLELQFQENTGFFNIEKKYEIENAMRSFGRNLAVQGEICGPGIQKNPLQLLEIDFFIYDVYDIDNKRYLTADERANVVNMLGLKHVPILNFETKPLSTSMHEVLEDAKGQSWFGTFRREGVVYKSTTLVNGQTLSFKAINNDYLLHHGE